MYQRLTKYEVAERLKADEYANWSYEGAITLAEYFETMEDDLGEEFKLDVVAIRCDWAEYGSEDDVLKEYPDHDLMSLAQETEVLELDNGHYIIRAF